MLRKVTRPFRRLAAAVPQLNSFRRGYSAWHRSKIWPEGQKPEGVHASPPNDLEKFFESRKEGRGIWKWTHYFEIYDRHFNRFRGTDVHMLEIGIYSGGSLEMWSDYFGPNAHIYGVDIEPACKAYEDDSISVFIGDQADRDFWRRFRSQVPRVDIVVDDGGHQLEQQIVTFEELLPYMPPGAVYLCEDLNSHKNPFAGYIYGFASNLNGGRRGELDPEDREIRRVISGATKFQSAVHSVHLYPFVTVIEKNRARIQEFVAEKHGTVWSPLESVATELQQIFARPWTKKR
jgi:hypothetical protein